MKRTFITIALCVVTFTCLQAAGPDDVAGVRWDSSPNQARQILSTRPGVILQAETPGDVTFTGGMFAGYNVKSWRFAFTDGKVSSVRISVDSKSGKDAKGWFADQDFATLQKLLEGKYGRAYPTNDPTSQTRTWNFPDALVPAAKKSIELHRDWSGKRDRLELTYVYTRAKGVQAPSALSNPGNDY